jgi:hypothetical protein
MTISDKPLLPDDPSDAQGTDKSNPMPEREAQSNSAGASTDAPSISLTPLEHAEAWLALYLDAALSAEEYRWTQSHLGRFEAAAYLASRGRLDDAHRNAIVATFEAARAREQAIAKLFAGLSGEVKRRNLPPWLDNGLSYGDPDGALTSAILRAGEQCGVQGLDAWWTGIGDELLKAVDSGALQGMAVALWCFNVARSDSAVQLPSICAAVEAIARPRLNISPTEQVWPWITETGEFDAARFAFYKFASVRCHWKSGFGDDAEDFELLIDSQSPEGYWKDGDQASHLVTAATVLLLCSWRPPGWEDSVVRAIEWLSKQNSDGSWNDEDNLDPGFRTAMVACTIRVARNALVTKARTLPNWDGDWLTYDGVELYQPDGRAKNRIKVLEAFQEEGWPTSILDPLEPDPTGNRRRQTVEDLNSKQDVLRFYCPGNKEKICWEER